MNADSPSSRRLPWPVPMLCCALAVASVSLLFQFVPSASAADAPSDRVSAAQSALVAATSVREQAEARSEQVSGNVAQLQTESSRLGEQDTALTAELVTSRQRLRDYAVAAYIDGGQSAIFRASLSPEKAVALSWQSNISIGQSSSANQAAKRFEALKASAAPVRASLAEQLDAAKSELVFAQFDAIQAAAFERDAEAELAAAKRQQEQAKAAAAAAQAAADAASSAAQQTQENLSQGSAEGSEPPQDSLAPTAPTFALMGNPSAQESATLARIRRCESRGNYSIVSASGRYRGAYQFDFTTWRGVGGSGDPAAASPSEQDYRALLLLRLRGTRPWPICGR